MPEPAQRLTDVYHAALQRPAAEREAFLREACGGDEAMRREISSLLAYVSQADRFMQVPAASPLARAEASDVVSGPPMIGRNIGPYRIVAALGAGGMGEVYRARDARLGRDVAIKILPARFSSDAGRRARFAREARLLAGLKHPHIAALYGLEESSDVTALVLELVEGITLADRLAEGPLRMREALTIARQIAAALEAAHDNGVVHRDLKPANVVLERPDERRPSGELRVKVLDFGLAKPLLQRGAAAHGAAQDLADETGEGRVLGTPAYMSPEQARGYPVGPSSDLWAFGCVLFEMLAGANPFEGRTASDTFARILDHEPDWSRLPPQTPGPVRTLLRRCLRKDPHQRLRDAATVRIELDDLEHAPADAAHAAPIANRRLRAGLAWLAAAVAVLTLAGMGAIAWLGRASASAEQIEFEQPPPGGGRFSGSAPEFALSPDGRTLAFTATNDGVSRLWLRTLGMATPQALPGTEGARSPFWKPDGHAIAFFAQHQLRIVQRTGGSPVVVCDVPHPEDATVIGGAWSPGDVIVFGRANEPLSQVSARQTGGPAKRLTTLGANDVAHRWPSFLPDGRHFLFFVQSTSTDDVRVGSIDSSETLSLGPFESHATYVAGQLFFVRGDNLMAQSFDAERLRLVGEPRHLGIQVGIDTIYRRAMFSISASGQVAYRAIGQTPGRLTWLDDRGSPLGTVGPPGRYLNLDISSDDRRLAVSRLLNPPGVKTLIDLWTIDLDNGTPLRLTDDPGWEFDPTWSPDGRRVAFNGARTPPKLLASLFVRPATSDGDDVELGTAEPGVVRAPDWSSDRETIAFELERTGTGLDLWIMSLAGARRSRPFLATVHDEEDPVFAPDGRWIAYSSNATGRSEVYVRPFPAGDGIVAVSRDGGVLPRWRGNDGKQLFFLSLDGRMMAATFDAAVPRARDLRPLFQTPLRPGHNRSYDLTADGRRFLLPIPEPPTPITVVLYRPGLLDP